MATLLSHLLLSSGLVLVDVLLRNSYAQEEESRREEQLKYSCKCSFLEIYNEQITDLLEPSSTNLQVNKIFSYGPWLHAACDT